MNIEFNGEDVFIKGTALDTDNGEKYYAEKAQLKGIKLSEMPSDVCFAVAERLSDLVDNTDFTIHKIDDAKARIVYDDGASKRDFEELDYIRDWIMKKYENIKNREETTGDVRIINFCTDDGAYIEYSTEVTGETFDEIIEKATLLHDEVNGMVDTCMKETSQIIDELLRKIDMLQRLFEENYGFTLFSEYKVTSIINLKRDVIDEDSLTVRLRDVTTQLLENINKNQFDKITQIKSKGEIVSIANFLKLRFQEDSKTIEDSIILPMWAVYNIRTEFAHKKNRNYRKALNILNIKETELTPEYIWKKCIEALGNSFSLILEMLLNDKCEKENEYFMELAKENLVTDAKLKIISLIKYYPLAEPYLHILSNRGVINDIDLAKMLNKKVTEVRKDLYPFLGQVILYSYTGNGHTKIWIIDEVLPVIREVLINNED